ncbi:MAG: tRNA (N6-threonylcarbamoyladenosine(37)-N6)-methyltransferase TrmO, partial [Thermodesulfobacteriota bacterium]
MNETAVQLEVIGRVHSCFTEKFGIPRQPGRVPASRGRIEMMAPFDRDEMFKGLESFSHIWVHFLFHQLHGGKWQPTVRPPRLGGKTRVGIFGTRSPHRPNRLGLSVVRLVGVVRESGRLF